MKRKVEIVKPHRNWRGGNSIYTVLIVTEKMSKVLLYQRHLRPKRRDREFKQFSSYRVKLRCVGNGAVLMRLFWSCDISFGCVTPVLTLLLQMEALSIALETI